MVRVEQEEPGRGPDEGGPSEVTGGVPVREEERETSERREGRGDLLSLVRGM